MRRNKFKELMRCMRFDDMFMRAAQNDDKQEKIEPIHELLKLLL